MDPLAGQDDHVRRLLDQRAARSDHARWASVSDVSDSPSVYSHAAFSPRYDNLDVGTSAPRTAKYSPIAFANPPRQNLATSLAQSQSPLFDRERLNDPALSGLDLSDDPRASYATHRSYGRTHNDEDDDDEDDEAAESDDPGLSSHMSFLGPKMKFHSPAPWEMSDDTEADSDGSEHTTSGSKRGGKSKQAKSDGFIKGLGFVARGSFDQRPSMDSTRSGVSSTSKAGEGLSAQAGLHGALQALAQASISSASLNQDLSPTDTSAPLLLGQDLLVARSRTPSNSQFPPGSLRPPPPSPRSIKSTQASPTSIRHREARIDPSVASGYVLPAGRPRAQTFSPRPPSPSTYKQNNADFAHPYANPNYAVPSSRWEPPPTLGGRSPLHHMSHSDTGSTISRSSDTLDTFSPSHTMQSEPITPDTSASSFTPEKGDHPPHNRGSSFQGRMISPPMPLPSPGVSDSGRASPRVPSDYDAQHFTFPAGGASNIPGWQGSLTSPTFALISLEEAQAQARERMRSAGGHSAISSPVPTSIPDPDSPASGGGSTGRARSRTTSAGLRAILAVHAKSIDPPPPVPQPFQAPQYQRDVDPSSSAPGGKAIKHKKSGFMRLFRDRVPSTPTSTPSSPPRTPVGPPDGGLATPVVLVAPRMPRLGRVPVPSVTPSLMDSESRSPRSSESSDDRTECAGSSLSLAMPATPTLTLAPAPGRRPLRRRTPPPPIITTSPVSAGPTGHAYASAPGHTASQSQSGPSGSLAAPHPHSQSGAGPQSAPPGTSQFRQPMLSLRPVSTVFSAHFADHIVVVPEAGGARPGAAGQQRPGLSSGRTSNESSSGSSSSQDHRSHLESIPDSEIDTPLTASSGAAPRSPDGRGHSHRMGSSVGTAPDRDGSASGSPAATIKALQDQIATARKAWQQQIRDLESQVRDLQEEVRDLRVVGNNKDFCEVCGRGVMGSGGGGGGADGYIVDEAERARLEGVPNRPRARTGAGGMFGNNGDSATRDLPPLLYD